jgi:threonine/homoserine/homoserine lactone efflux protein
VLILALTSVVIEFFVQLLYAIAADRASDLAARPAFAKITNRVAGSLMIAAGLGLAAARRA